jgi:hypothetical protein
MKKWTEASDEVKKCFDENEVIRCVTSYSDNKKRWKITTTRGEFVFEQFFDCEFFNTGIKPSVDEPRSVRRTFVPSIVR